MDLARAEMREPYDKPDHLVVRTWPLGMLWGWALKHHVSEPFTEKTGIPVAHIEYTSVDPPPDLVRDLQRNRRPLCDVLYGNTIPLIHLARAGHCAPLMEEEFPVLKHLNGRARPAAEGLEGWPLVIVYDVRYAMMVRDAAFPDGPPQSWNAMLDPTSKGRISLYPGGKGFFPIAQVMGGGTLDAIPGNMEPC